MGEARSSLVQDDDAPGAKARLEDLVSQVVKRLDEIIDTGDSLQALLDAMLAVTSGVKLESTLRHMLVATADLVDARYGTLEVLSCDTSVPRFVHVGDERTDDRTGRTGRAHANDDPPAHGRLGDLIGDEEPVRLPDAARYPDSNGWPPKSPSLSAFIGVQVQVGSEIFGKLYLTNKKNGLPFTTDDEVVVQALGAAAGIAIQCRRRQRRLDTASEITSELLTGNTADQVLPVVAERALELLRADGAFIMLDQGPADRRRSELGAHAGLTEEQVATLTAVRGEDLADIRLAGFGPALSGPLRSGEDTVGTIVALRLTDSAQFQPEERTLLESFADQASIVLEVSAKQRVERQLGIISDRDRIARDLHDHVIQRLFAVGMSLQGTLQRSDDLGVRRRIENSIEQLDQTVREIRTSIFDLHTPSSPSLRRRLLDTIAEVCDGTDVSPSTRISGPIDTLVPDRVGDHAEAVIREALTNAIRHAAASELMVSVEARADLVIDIEDDGDGIPGDARRSGLLNLEKRAAECGGTCVINSRPGGGTKLRWQVPLPS